MNLLKEKEKARVLLGLPDYTPEFDIIFRTESDRVLGYLQQHLPNIEEIPSHFLYIVTELTIARYNKLGSEGIKEESVEGHSIKYDDSNALFDQYRKLLVEYVTKETDSGEGRVVFL